MKSFLDRRGVELICAVLSVTSLAGCTKQNDSRSTPVPAASNTPPAASTPQTEPGAMTSSPGAVSAPYDLQFIDTMIAHHEGAIAMAEVAATKASRPEVQTFASAIVSDQNREIAQMRTWREQWYQAARPAVNMGLPGMMESMRGMNTEHMKGMSGMEFDHMFVDMMIPHHEGAIAMVRDAFSRSEHQELKNLAQQIIDKQQSEIVMMKGWRTKGHSDH